MSGTDYSKEYDEYWARTDRWGSSSFSDADALASRILKVAGGGSVLDVGCGMGELVHNLLRLGIDATGADVASRCIDEGNRRAPGRFKLASVLKLPFADASFDTVVCTDMLEHLDEADVFKAIDELARIARKTLFVCVSTREDRDKRWHLTIQSRDWWERQFIERNLRKHPRSQSALAFQAIERESDSGNATLIFEPMPANALKSYPLKSLKAERDLHTDMLREAGRRSDAHVARYQLAATFIRPNDRVLDVSSGLGYGAAVLWANAEPECVTGIDLSEFAVEYANANYAQSGQNAPTIEFVRGDAQSLTSIKDESIDLVVSFETLEHLPDPEAFIAEAHRVLTPGGRFIASVPNDWTDETGKDPNPEHLHVYTWDSLANQVTKKFLVEAAYAQIAGGGMKLTDQQRSLQRREVNPDGKGPHGKAEWWLVVAMKDPVGATKSTDANRHFTVIDDDKAFHVTNFARDYDNPWLVRSMVSIGLRAESEPLLESIALRTLVAARQGSPDEGAALCMLGYQKLQHSSAEATLGPFLKQLHNYHTNADKSPHAWRWRVSNEYVAACLLLKAGRREDALKSFQRCAAMDPCTFSPLLATKTIASCFEAGMMLVADGDDQAARALWRNGIESAQEALSGDWTNIVADFDHPLSFGLAEACELLDAATRCSWALIGHQQDASRPGYAWEASLKRSPLSDLRWLKDLDQAKNWHESQHANWRKLAMDRERDAKHWSDAAERLTTGKEWLEAERGRLNEHGRASEQTIEQLRSWIDEQESGKVWLDEQRLQLVDAVGKRDQTIDELRAWIAAQDCAKATQETNTQQQIETIGQMHERITELSAWVEEQEKGRVWLDEQRTSLLEKNASSEKLLAESTAWIAQLEERCRGFEEQCRSIEQENTQTQDQLANLRSAHAVLSSNHYEFLNRVKKASQLRFGVRKSVRDIVSSSTQLATNANGQDAISTQVTHRSGKAQSDDQHQSSETERT